MPRRKITKRALTRKGKQPPTTPRPPPQAAERDSAPPRAVLPTSPEIQQHFVRRLALLADDAAALSDTVEGQSRERGENDAVMIRNIARVLGALTFGAVTKDDKARAIVHDLGAMARTALERDGIAGVRLQEDGTPIGPPIDPEEGDEPSFARGGDVETARTTMLRHLHRSFVDWLEKGKTDEELAKKTCARVNGIPSSLRVVCRRHSVDLCSEAEIRGLARDFAAVRKRKDAKEIGWWRLAERMLVRAAIRWRMPETEARKLFSFALKEGQWVDRQEEALALCERLQGPDVAALAKAALLDGRLNPTPEFVTKLRKALDSDYARVEQEKPGTDSHKI